MKSTFSQAVHRANHSVLQVSETDLKTLAETSCLLTSRLPLVSDVIPFGSVVGNHAHLAGLNVVGLKRRGFSRETIRSLRSAYRMLYAKEGTFSERLEDTAATFAEAAEVMQIVNFIRNSKNRALCLPR